MSCRLCGSENQGTFYSEINVHFRELKNLTRRPILVFPKLVVCLDCGLTEFRIEETELRRLAQGPEHQMA
jgi:hypothetical protein